MAGSIGGASADRSRGSHTKLLRTPDSPLHCFSALLEEPLALPGPARSTYTVVISAFIKFVLLFLLFSGPGAKPGYGVRCGAVYFA